MKKINVAVLLLLMFATIGLAQENCTRNTEPAGGFSMCPPPGWNIEVREGQQFHLMFAAGKPVFTPNINFKDETIAAPLDDYAQASIKTILAGTEQLGATSIAVLEKKNFVTSSSVSGIRVAFRTEYKGLIIRTLQYYFDGKSGTKLIVTCTALESDKDTLDQVFDTALKTFRLDNRLDN